MDDIVFFYPEGHSAHAERGHPERPERVEVIRNTFQDLSWWDRYPHIAPESLPNEVLQKVHQPAYLKNLREACSRGNRMDMDTYTTKASWQLALNAAGGAIAVVDSIWDGRAMRGFALTRPPGHHATPNRAMGFCLLNNVAIATEYLIQMKNAKRLAIIDLDQHHGNGTQDIFWMRPDVLYLSTHQYPHYPGTGHEEEIGAGEGEGTTVNFPMPPGSGDQAYLTIMNDAILPLLSNFDPEMILVSYGFDTHWRDPLGNLLLSAETYGELISQLTQWADENADGHIALLLEGGYDLKAATACTQSVIAALLGIDYKDPIGSSPSPEGDAWREMFARVKEIWDL
jgi:acetoin utilization deacetylase AcuC-like enzyme